MRVIIEAKRPDYGDWRVRNRLATENFAYREGQITLAQLQTLATNMAYGWQYCEPLTDFRVQVDHAYQERPATVANPPPITKDQRNGIRGYKATKRHDSQAAGARRSQLRRGSGNNPSSPVFGGDIDPSGPSDVGNAAFDDGI